MNRSYLENQTFQTKSSFDSSGEIKILCKKLSSTDELRVLIGNLTCKILRTQRDYCVNRQLLLDEKKDLYLKSGLRSSKLALALAKIDQRIADYTNTHEMTATRLARQRTELLKDLFLKTRHTKVTVKELEQQHETVESYLQKHRLYTVPSEVDDLNRQIKQLNRTFLNEMEDLRQIQAAAVPQILESRGLRVAPSGHVLTETGRQLTHSEASCLGLFKGLEGLPLKTMLKDHKDTRKTDVEGSLTSLTTSSSYIPNEDFEYLTKAFIKPLSLALADTGLNRPKDGVQYLSHLLFKYRYNQEVSDERRQQILEIIREKEQLEKEKLHLMLEDEAQKVILDMIRKAEEDAIRCELERIARETIEIGG